MHNYFSAVFTSSPLSTSIAVLSPTDSLPTSPISVPSIIDSMPIVLASSSLTNSAVPSPTDSSLPTGSPLSASTAVLSPTDSPPAQTEKQSIFIDYAVLFIAALVIALTLFVFFVTCLSLISVWQ